MSQPIAKAGIIYNNILLLDLDIELLKNIRDGAKLAARLQENAAATSGHVQRENVWGSWIFGNVKVPKYSRMIRPNNGLPPCLEFILNIPGKKSDGVKVYAFGATEADKGGWVTGILDFKSKQKYNQKIFYFRLQKIVDVHSDANLIIMAGEDYAGMRDDLPRTHVRVPHPNPTSKPNHFLEFSVGFSWYPEPFNTPRIVIS